MAVPYELSATSEAEAPAAAAPTWSVSHENMAVPVLRTSATVLFCFAFCKASRKLGISSAAMMPMIAITISSSISVNPFWRFRILLNMGSVSSRCSKTCPSVDSIGANFDFTSGCKAGPMPALSP